MFDEEILKAAEALVLKLTQTGSWITVAESCTGGLLGGAITSVPGASDCFGCGFITYSNEAKSRLLSVSPETLAAVGAVSEETAREMALGALEAGGATVALSVTGIAGPSGGSAEKPVGLVYIGLALGDVCRAERFDFGDIGRDGVRRKTVLAALTMALESL